MNQTSLSGLAPERFFSPQVTVNVGCGGEVIEEIRDRTDRRNLPTVRSHGAAPMTTFARG